MSYDCDKCKVHVLECECPIIRQRIWISKEEAKNFFPDGTGIIEDDFCSLCKNELVACVC